ncbi:MAG TPA: glycosyltransferase family 2 protein [Patescibacteria group bacterium]|nr:glycosyltransferase family 2 protein [Patescibacteria group bacterium]
MKLSIIIPVFNEEKTILEVLQKVIAVTIPGITKEIIIINDGSIDKTAEKVTSFLKKEKLKNISFTQHKKNAGKGATVITGIRKATGDYIVIQDADLEYDPKFLKELVQPILLKKADIVYGTRLKRLPHFTKEEKNLQFLLHYIGNRFLSLVTSVLYGTWITDMETCYKLFPRNALQHLAIHAKGFAFEPEITAKLLKLHLRVIELPIETVPRNYEEGKKLVAMKDGPIALWTLLKYRFTD